MSYFVSLLRNYDGLNTETLHKFECIKVFIKAMKAFSKRIMQHITAETYELIT